MPPLSPRYLAPLILALWTTAALAHGGAPSTGDVLLGSGSVSLVTSHGLFAEDDGWAWICDEATGGDMAASAIRTPERWMVGTVTGLLTSSDGCQWNQDPGLEGQRIVRVTQDIHDPQRAWIGTTDALWVIDGAEDARVHQELDLSLRHLGQGPDGAWLLVGFDGPSPVAQVDGERLELPITTGRMEVITSDDAGRHYVRVPAGLSDQLLRISAQGVESLLVGTPMIADVATLGDDLYVMHREGVLWSPDDGATFSQPLGRPITCLRPTEAGFYACPLAPSAEALLFASQLAPDPATWAWSSHLDFAQVQTNTCGIGTTAGDICPYLWPISGAELGALQTSEPNAQETSPSGCEGAPGPGGLLTISLALMALALPGRRRARIP